eukprot:TRINITY_DN10603_c0_g1_i3.p1 TRINITY_DN10603_c0_g1~~TRINITY_DN10603_c0_g1_i3.p1  ORF type:complete len:357 (-),score=58.06 TRINITY_DN10603_c0_g1_i3:501-1571(-)
MKRILKDGYLIFEKQMRFGSFHHTMPIDNHMITIVELEDRYDFRIDNQPFSMLYLSERNKRNFKQENYSKKYEDVYCEPELKPREKNYTAQTRKDELEFNTGFGQFDYRPSRESLLNSRAHQSKPEPEFVTGKWDMRAEDECRASANRQENYDWDGPSNFQIDGSSVPARSSTHAYSQPTAVQPRPQMYTQPPIKEQPKPIIDFLDTDQPSNLPDDFFSGGLNAIPPASQHKQPEILNFPQQTVQTAASPQRYGQPQTGSYPTAAPSQPPAFQLPPSSMNPTVSYPQLGTQDMEEYVNRNMTSMADPSLQYVQPPMNPAPFAQSPPRPFAQPPVSLEEKKSLPDPNSFDTATGTLD